LRNLSQGFPEGIASRPRFNHVWQESVFAFKRRAEPGRYTKVNAIRTRQTRRILLDSQECGIFAMRHRCDNVAEIFGRGGQNFCILCGGVTLGWYVTWAVAPRCDWLRVPWSRSVEFLAGAALVRARSEPCLRIHRSVFRPPTKGNRP
jgi:hypothetical protein